MALYPRQVNVLGAENIISCVGILSKTNTTGMFVLGRSGGPNNPAATGPAETYLYLDSGGIPRAGGVTEAATSAATGIALGTAVTPAVFNPSRQRGFTLFGSNRIASSLKISGISDVTKQAPALGIMYTGGNIMYIYIGTGGFLCYGDETAWLAGTATNKLAATAIPTSGSNGRHVDGRTIVGNDDPGFAGALVIASGGKSGALGLFAGDFTNGAVLYIDATPKPVFAAPAAWQTYAAS